MAFAHTTRARLSLVPPKRVQIHDAAGFASCCGPAGCAPPTGDRRSTSTPASRPTPGAPLPRTLASPRTGLTPAGCPELDARLHPNLLSCPDARTAGRTSIYLAGCGRSIWPSLGADHQGLSCCFDDFRGDGVQLVDFQDAADLTHESFDEPEVAAGDPGDSVRRLVGEGGVEG